MILIYLLLYIAAAVCFGIAAASTRPNSRVHHAWLGWLGLLFWVLVPLLQTLTNVA